MGKQRVPRDGKKVPPLTVDNPHLCLYATTQPQILFESMSRNDLRDGWLARNIFFISKARPKPQANATREPDGMWTDEGYRIMLELKLADGTVISTPLVVVFED